MAVGESGQCWPFFIFEQLWSVHSFSAYMCISLPAPDDRESDPPRPADPQINVIYIYIYVMQPVTVSGFRSVVHATAGKHVAGRHS